METRFFLPVAVAAALHATAFLGFRSLARNPVVSPVQSHVEPSPEPILIVPINDPVVDASTDSSVAKGHPDNTPRSEDVEIYDAREHFEQTLLPISPNPVVSTSIIPLEPIGRPEGVSVPGGFTVGIAALDNPPRTRTQVAPVYPNDVKLEGRGGEVLIEFVVDETGGVLDARVVKSTDSRFEAATLKAVTRWRFEPGKVKGRAVRFRMVAPVVFSLET
jgi:protein TonB